MNMDRDDPNDYGGVRDFGEAPPGEATELAMRLLLQAKQYPNMATALFPAEIELLCRAALGRDAGPAYQPLVGELRELTSQGAEQMQLLSWVTAAAKAMNRAAAALASPPQTRDSEVERLREALRETCITVGQFNGHCSRCNGDWSRFGDERHFDNCLAADPAKGG